MRWDEAKLDALQPARNGRQPGTVGAERRAGRQRRARWAACHTPDYQLISQIG